MKIQSRREATLSITTAAQLQTMKAAHVLCHAIKIVNMDAVLMQYRLDVFVSQNNNNWYVLRIKVLSWLYTCPCKLNIIIVAQMLTL